MTVSATRMDRLPATRRACGNCGRLGHLATTCTHPAKAIDKMGIEVEGYWRTNVTQDDEGNNLPTYGDVQRVAERWHMDGAPDGSVRGERDHTAWEFKTRPGSLGEAISQLIAVYPHAVNSYCGMHVHVSFRSVMDISWLCTQAFFDYFAQRWEAWGTRMEIHRDSEFWTRLRGDNDYCLKNQMDDHRRDITGHDRYRQLNFSAWNGHKTLECRMLPMFKDARIGVSALEELVSIYEDYLNGVAVATLDRAVVVTADGFPAANGPAVMAYESALDLAVPGTAEVHTLDIEAPDYGPCPEGFIRVPENRLYYELENRVSRAADSIYT